MNKQGWMGRSAKWIGVWLAFVVPLPVAAEVFTGRASAVPDGDTLWVQPDDGRAARKLRLQGIDAPEICQSGGVASREALQRLLGRQRLRVVVRYYDVYGRGLARIQIGRQDVGAAMVRSGQAWSSRWRRSVGPYAQEESAARQARAGLFAETAPELPGEFRKRHGTCYLVK